PRSWRACCCCCGGGGGGSAQHPRYPLHSHPEPLYNSLRVHLRRVDPREDEDALQQHPCDHPRSRSTLRRRRRYRRRLSRGVRRTAAAGRGGGVGLSMSSLR
ncbi:unnamed protein product, partial [Ectocarpus sp. 12 AP-2014]